MTRSILEKSFIKYAESFQSSEKNEVCYVQRRSFDILLTDKTWLTDDINSNGLFPIFLHYF